MSPASQNQVAHRLATHRDWILQGEVCSLLHDLGKLSSAFLHYRRNWHTDPHGWDGDPHDHHFLDHWETKGNKSDFATLFKALERPADFLIPDKASQTFNPTGIMTSHVNPRPGFIYDHALKAADGIDARCDRNNPLWSAEQTDRRATTIENARKPWFRSNVFGFEAEETRICPEALDTKRVELFQEMTTGRAKWILDSLMPTRTEREAFLEILEECFEPSFGDTTRPDNDTSLWEHSYSVASIAKAFMAHYTIYGPGRKGLKLRDYFADARFTMIGVGWDAVSFVGRGQRIHDLGARRELLMRVRSEIRHLIEYSWAIGNCVYEDDSSTVFLIPEVWAVRETSVTEEDDVGFRREAAEEYVLLLDMLKREILDLTLGESKGELWARVVFLTDADGRFEATQDTRQVVTVLSALRQRRPGLDSAESGGHGAIWPSISADDTFIPADLRIEDTPVTVAWPNNSDVCPICGLRPAKEKVEVGSICKVCFTRRTHQAKNQRAIDGKRNRVDAGTSFVSEIADRNGRVALLVGRFHLDRWLDGKAVRTSFVRQAYGLRKELDELGDNRQFEAEELEIRRFLDPSKPGWNEFNYGRITSEIDACRNASELAGGNLQRAQNTLFLYDRRATWIHGRNRIVRETLGAARDPASPSGRDGHFNPEHYWQVLAKTATPSTLLDVWRTTQEFFESVCRSRPGPGAIAAVLKPLLRVKQRRFYDLSHGEASRLQRLSPYAVYSGRVADQKIEFFIDDDRKHLHVLANGVQDPVPTVSPLVIREITDGAGLTVVDAELSLPGAPTPEDVWPWREILATPDMLLALVPAENALAISSQIVDEFRKRFGKVGGRLSFSLGNIFFQQHMPMFIVLDAGARMLETFRDRAAGNKDDPRAEDVWTVKEAHWNSQADVTFENGLRWLMPIHLGDGQVDYHHPYFVVDADPSDSPNLRSRAPAYCEIGDGRAVIHATEVRPGDAVRVVDSVYDYEFLDSSAGRFRISATEEGRINPALNNSATRPFRLEELDQRISRTWELIQKSGISDTSFRAMVDLLWSRLEEWKVKLPLDEASAAPHEQEWGALVRQQVDVRFSMYAEKTRGFLEQQIRSGLFFEVTTLYLHVLKQSIQQEET